MLFRLYDISIIIIIKRSMDEILRVCKMYRVGPLDIFPRVWFSFRLKEYASSIYGNVVTIDFILVPFWPPSSLIIAQTFVI